MLRHGNKSPAKERGMYREWKEKDEEKKHR
jgi:hypothetical protein